MLICDNKEREGLDMIGSLEKVYSRPICVSEDQLRGLAKIVTERFEEVEYDIHTKDGACYKLPTIDDMMDYPNPDARKIVKIDIRGEKSKDSHGLYPSFSLSLFDMNQYDLSCILSLKNLDEAEITLLDQRVNEFVKKSKNDFWWIHTFLFYLVVGFVLYVLLLLFLNLKTSNEFWHELSHNTSVLFSFSGLCMMISFFVVREVVNWMTTKGGFGIGEQKETMKKKAKRRYSLFGLVLLPLLLDVAYDVIKNLIG